MSSLDKQYFVTAKSSIGDVYANSKGEFGVESKSAIAGIDHFKEAIPMTHEQAIKIIRSLDEKRKNHTSLWVHSWRMQEL